MKLTYKQRIFSCFFIIVALFAIIIIVLEQREEQKFKEELLKTKLDFYTEIVHLYLEQEQSFNNIDQDSLEKLYSVLPQDIRLTVINNEGNVLLDKNVTELNTLDNHLDRPEIRKALYYSYGINIRHSTSTDQDFLYFAKHYSEYYVRVALPYNIETKNILKADNLFIYICLVLFIPVLLLLNYAAGRFGKSIKQLKKVTLDIKDGRLFLDSKDLDFPHDELGSIGKELVEIFKQKEQNAKTIKIEREKLIQHFQYSGEGLGIFNQEFKKLYTNSHFIQYVNTITHKPTLDIELIFDEFDFEPIRRFLSSRTHLQKHYTYQLNKTYKVFFVQVVVFEDNSFEVTIRDITKIEKNRILKQEMTNNIAHELRTPITSIRGYLETLHDNKLKEEKQIQFIDKAYKQSLRLSQLVEDINLISTIEDAPMNFKKEKLNLLQIINNVRIDLSDKLYLHDDKLTINVDENVVLVGNYSLLYSIFRNLIENSIYYAGKGVEIYINNYFDDDKYIYLSFYDTGVGVPNEAINRLFERFYRLDEGRSRNTGGSGLGLSIVKNSVLLHKGDISAKNRTGGGLEILFSLSKVE